MANKAILINSSLVARGVDAAAEVQSRLAGWDVLVSPDDSELEPRYQDLRIAYGGSPKDLIRKAPNLEWLQLGGAGADRIFMSGEPRPAFAVTNASGVHAVPISEHLLAMLLFFARWFHKARNSQIRHGTWNRPERSELLELAGSTVLVVGLGAIGGRFAEIASALGCRVVAVRRHPERGSGAAERVVGFADLRKELPAADHVVITTPLTRETQGLIGREELAVMKPGSFLYNIGRGRIIDEAAMITAIESGALGGAGLDVFEEEPLPDSSPLWSMENVLVTCHSGLTPVYADRAWEIFMDNLDRFVSGKELRNLVDPDLGY